MKEKELRAILKELTELISDGVHIVDVDGVAFVYNKAMSEIEGMKAEDVVGKPFSELFDTIDVEDSTMRKALKDGKKNLNYRQTYKNKNDKEITTTNSTVPVILDNKIIGAIEVAKDLTQIKQMTDKIIEYRNQPNKIRRYSFDSLVGDSANFLAVIEKAKIAAKTKASVFIYGETGTGKELFSQSIHYDGNRGDKPFVAQNCAAVPETLFEGILFGTSKGAFTGAVDRPGLFEEANGGTLLLDEISAMPYELQSKLLRVLQEGSVRRVGGSKEIPVDVRIIATVNERPLQLIEEGALRKDLYYRLNIVNLEIPPLRERKSDIKAIATALLEKHNRELGKRIEKISDKALDKLKGYSYSGNVRELENIIMSAVALSEKEKILKPEHISLSNGDGMKKFAGSNADSIDGYNPATEAVGDYLERVEKKIILEMLEEADGNVTKTAEKLGMKRQTLQHKLKKYS